MLQRSMSCKNGVVWLYNCSGNLWCWIDGKFQFRFFTIINGQTFHEKRSKSRTSSSSEGMEDQETLKTRTLVSQLSDSIEYKINDFLADGVMTSCIVIGSIFFSSYQLFRVEELTIGSSSYLIYNSRFEIDEYSTRDVLSCSGLREKSVERVITSADSLVTWHLSIRLDSMFKAIQLPASITNLATSLANVD